MLHCNIFVALYTQKYTYIYKDIIYTRHVRCFPSASHWFPFGFSMFFQPSLRQDLRALAFAPELSREAGAQKATGSRFVWLRWALHFFGVTRRGERLQFWCNPSVCFGSRASLEKGRFGYGTPASVMVVCERLDVKNAS